MTQSEYLLRDSFDAVNRVSCILPLDQENAEYMFASRDAVSLFPNNPLILKRVYNEKLISTSLPKRLLKKLILDTCQKMALSFNKNLYDQSDGISMVGSFGPVTDSIIMTEWEN